MQASDDLWNKYCSFYDKDFDWQVEQNEKEMKNYMKKWSITKTAKKLCPKGIKSIEDVPITDFDDYPVLKKFGEVMEKSVASVPRNKGELWWDYYNRILKNQKAIIEDWMPEEIGTCFRTSGSTGRSRWFPHGKGMVEKYRKDTVSLAIMGCSEEWGTTKIKSGDIIMNAGAPIPYGSGFALKMLSSEFKLYPPLEVTDNISNMRTKLNLILNGLRKGQEVHVILAMAAQLNMIIQALIAPEKLYKDLYTSMNPGMKKFILYLLYLKSKRSKSELQSVKEMLPIKGILTAGFDSKLYADLIKEQYGTDPIITYVSSELGMSMMGMPDRKMDMMPCMRLAFYEFIDKKKRVKKINELKKNGVYEIVGTPFGSIIARYTVGDLLRVVDFRDDGMPIFNFESRKDNQIEIKGYFRISEAIAFEIMERAGLRNSDRWSVAKIFEPDEHLLFLMEKDWDYDEIEASKLLYKTMLNKYEFFKNYVNDFGIKDPLDIIRVRYLKKGAFMRFTMKRMKGGLEFGQYKSPKVITPEKDEVRKLLCEV